MLLGWLVWAAERTMEPVPKKGRPKEGQPTGGEFSFRMLWSKAFCALLSTPLAHLWFPCSCGEQVPVLWVSYLCFSATQLSPELGKFTQPGKDAAWKCLKLPFPGGSLHLMGAGSWWTMSQPPSFREKILSLIDSDGQSMAIMITAQQCILYGLFLLLCFTILAPSLLLPGIVFPNKLHASKPLS